MISSDVRKCKFETSSAGFIVDDGRDFAVFEIADDIAGENEGVITDRNYIMNRSLKFD